MKKILSDQQEKLRIIKKYVDQGMEDVQIRGENETHYVVSFAKPVRWDEDGEPAGYAFTIIKEEKVIGYPLQFTWTQEYIEPESKKNDTN
jgi:hypothetical protein